MITGDCVGGGGRMEKLINEKMVFLVPRGSLCWYFFFFFNSDRYRYRFFPPSFPLSSPACPVLFADLLSVFLLFRLCQVNIEI